MEKAHVGCFFKFPTARTLFSPWKNKLSRRRKHIINTHIEDVTLDTENCTPRDFSDGNYAKKPQIDNNTLTKILDANDKVQVALRGWYELEKQIDLEWVESENQNSTSGSFGEPGKFPHYPEHQPSSERVMEAISHQLQAVQHMSKTRGKATGIEHWDSMSSDATQSNSFTLPVAQQNLNSSGGNFWVDFSDSSESQISRPSPGARGGSNAWKSPFAFHTPREGWRAGPRHSSLKGSMLHSPLDVAADDLMERPHSVAAHPDVPRLHLMQTNRGPPTTVYCTPRLVQTEVHHRYAMLENPTAKPIHTVPSTKDYIEPEESEYASCTSRDLSGTGTLYSAVSSINERGSGSVDRLPSKDSTSLRVPSPPSHVLSTERRPRTSGSYSLGSLLEEEKHREDLVLPSRASLPFVPSEARAPARSEEFPARPMMVRKRAPARRIPPALRVRFTPEHLKDVLARVGDAPAYQAKNWPIPRI